MVDTETQCSSSAMCAVRKEHAVFGHVRSYVINLFPQLSAVLRKWFLFFSVPLECTESGDSLRCILLSFSSKCSRREVSFGGNLYMFCSLLKSYSFAKAVRFLCGTMDWWQDVWTATSFRGAQLSTILKASRIEMTIFCQQVVLQLAVLKSQDVKSNIRQLRLFRTLSFVVCAVNFMGFREAIPMRLNTRSLFIFCSARHPNSTHLYSLTRTHLTRWKLRWAHAVRTWRITLHWHVNYMVLSHRWC